MRKIFGLFVAFLLLTEPARAQTIPENTLIRDAEIEAYLTEWLTKLFNAAGVKLKPEVFLLANPDLNAAAMAGGRIIIHTGLITQSQDLYEILGVLAHETGHVVRGDIATLDAKLKQATLMNAMTIFLSGLASLAAANPAALGAGVLGGSQMAERSILKDLRTDESGADQSAVTTLDKLGIRADGLLTTLKRLHQKILIKPQDPYEMTHPLTPERVQMLEERVKRKRHKIPASFIKHWEDEFQWMKVKVEAFMSPPQTVLNDHKGNSPYDLYAQAIALSRLFRLDEALEQLKTLMGLYPNSPYFPELSGEILFKSGKVKESIVYLRKAQSLKQDAPLINLLLGHALLESGNPKEAITYLKKCVHLESDLSSGWYLLGQAYEQDGQKDYAQWAFAESLFKQEKVSLARSKAEEALKKTKDPSLKKKLEDLIHSMNNHTK